MPRIAIAVHDFEKTVDTFRNKLGMPVQDISTSSVKSLGAKLAMCLGEGSNIELMSPADPEAPLSLSLQRFLDRRGEGLFALMLEAPDPNAEAELLLDRGLNVLPLMAGAGGRDVHPNSTHGVLVRVYPVDSYKSEDPGNADPSDLSGIARVIIAVKDLEHASKVYGQMFGLEKTETTVDPERGVGSVICTPPSGGLIELVSVEDATRPFAKSIGRFLESHQEGMYALVLKSHNLPELADKLTSQGLVVRTSADSPDCLELERAELFGALLRIEARSPD